MLNQTCDPAAVRFGPFLYEPINGRLLRAGAELGVPPRALTILGCLVQQPGLLVTKQDLLDQVWKDAFVTDTSLSEAVSVLRQALGDDAQEPSYVQTVPRRGYRFIASVEPVRGPVPADPVPADTAPAEALWTPWFPWLACFAGGLAVGVLALALQTRPAIGTAPVTRFTLSLPAGQHLASGSSLAVSADGRLIVGVLEDASGARGAWARPLEAGAFQFLPGSEGARQPFVSADGDRVGILVGDRIRVMTMPSGAWSTVATAPLVRGATWLADGALVFAGGADGALRRVPSRGGDPIVIARPHYELGEAGLEAPTRAGATELVFSARRPGREPLLYVWPAAASSPRPLLQGSDPQWIAPSHLVYRSADRLHAAVVASSDWSVARTAILATQGRLSARDAFAATAATLVRAVPCRECGTVVIANDAGSQWPIGTPGSGVDAWQLTTDGTAIVAVTRHGDDRQVWRLGLDDESAVLLDRGNAYAVATDASGVHTVAASQRDGTWEIRPIAGSRARTALVRDAVPLEPSAVTSRGDIWFHKRGRNGSLDLWVVPNGQPARAILATPADEWDARPSPNGRYLAWISDARGDVEVAVGNAHTGEALGTWTGTQARWSADGTRLLVGDGSRWQALAIVDDGTPRLAPAAVPVGIRLPSAPPPTNELEVVIQWDHDVRQQAPVAPRPLPVVR